MEKPRSLDDLFPEWPDMPCQDEIELGSPEEKGEGISRLREVSDGWKLLKGKKYVTARNVVTGFSIEDLFFLYVERGRFDVGKMRDRSVMSGNPALWLLTGAGYFSEGDFVRGLRCAKEGLDSLRWSDVSIGFISRCALLPYKWCFGREIECNSLDANAYLGLACLESLGDLKRAEGIADFVVNKVKPLGLAGRASVILRGLIGDTLAPHNASYLSGVTDLLRSEEVSESEVRSRIDGLAGSEVERRLIRKTGDGGAIYREANWTWDAAKRAKGYLVPVVVDTRLGADGLAELVLSYHVGPTLYECLRRGEKEPAARVAKVLGYIHAVTEWEVPGAVVRTLLPVERVYDKLDAVFSRDLLVPDEIRNLVVDNVQPIESAMRGMPLVVNKDAHPEQWIVGRQITALDWEINRLVPITVDIANLTAFGDFFDEREEWDLVNVAIRSFEEYSGKVVDRAELKNAYLASVVFRKVCFVGAWSRKEKEACAGRRGEMLDGAIRYLDRIKKECWLSYSRSEEAYKSLRSGLVSLRSFLGSP